MKFKFVILAAGKGKRMGADFPKTLTPVGGKPILQYLYESIRVSGIDGDPIVVVGPERPQLCETFGGMCSYVVQEEQLGTGHAVHRAQEAAQDADALIVLYGDHPFVSAQTLRALAALHREQEAVVTIMTTTVPSYEGLYRAYVHWGRILRSEHGTLIGIREYKDANESERLIRELNPALYCFQTDWLWKNIGKLENTNASQEYYLTDLIELAVGQKHPIASVSLPPEEAVGINTPEEREIAEAFLLKLNRP